VSLLRQSLGLGGEPPDRGDRAEHLLAQDVGVRRHMVEDGRRGVVTRPVGNRCTRHDDRSLGDRVLDQTVHLLDRTAIHQRPQLGVLVGGRTDHDGRHALGERGDELVRDAFTNEEAVGRDTGLPADPHLGDHRLADRNIEVSVVEHQYGALPPSSIDVRSTWRPLCSSSNRPTRSTRERDLAQPWIASNGPLISAGLVVRHDRKQARGSAGFE